jgi:superfamily II DNA or RNA helicase
MALCKDCGRHIRNLYDRGMSTKTLHPYQSRLVRLMFDAMTGGERKIALVSPTGSGKSLMVTVLLERLRLGARSLRQSSACR